MLLKILIIGLLSLAPCVMWLWVIYRKDKYAPEPLSLIIRTFLIGAGIAIPVAIIELWLLPAPLRESLSLAGAAYQSFIVAGITEETGKMLVVGITAYKSRYFEEPSDGLVYSAAAALGFAALENVFYLISYGWETILIRGLISNLAHVLFACFWGYPMALAKTGFIRSRGWILAGWLLSVLGHGIFDFLLMAPGFLIWLVIPFFLILVLIYLGLFRHANRNSVYVLHKEKN